MSRIDEIKERLEKGFYDRSPTLGSTIKMRDKEPTRDVEYLLSILETAENALDQINNTKLTQDGKEMYMNIIDIKNTTGIALQQIRS